MRTFHLDRDEDPSGISGTGQVAEGVEFSDGRICLAWLSHVSSVAVYPNARQLESIHGHDGRTRIVWDDE